MNRYGGCLPRCDSDCINRSYYCAIASSCAAAVLYAIVKVLQVLLKAIIRDDKKNLEGRKKSLNFLLMIAIIAQIDVLYTIATNEITSINETASSSIFLGMAIIIGVAIIVGKAIQMQKKIYQWNHQIDNKIQNIKEWENEIVSYFLSNKNLNDEMKEKINIWNEEMSVWSDLIDICNILRKAKLQIRKKIFYRLKVI